MNSSNRSGKILKSLPLWRAFCKRKHMKVQIDASKHDLIALVTLLKSDGRFTRISAELEAAVALEDHNHEDDIPKEGDNPIILRSE